jgi:hypothetical protein
MIAHSGDVKVVLDQRLGRKYWGVQAGTLKVLASADLIVA